MKTTLSTCFRIAGAIMFVDAMVITGTVQRPMGMTKACARSNGVAGNYDRLRLYSGTSKGHIDRDSECCG